MHTKIEATTDLNSFTQAIEDASTPWTYVILAGVQIKIDLHNLPKILERTWRMVENSSSQIRFYTSPLVNGKITTVALGRFILECRTTEEVGFSNPQHQFDYREANLVLLTRNERQVRLGKLTLKATSRALKYFGAIAYLNSAA